MTDHDAPRPNTVVFDVGNVLLDWDPRHLYRSVFGDKHERIEWFLSQVATPQWNLEQDRGRSFADAVALLVAQHPEWADQIRAFDTRWQEMVAGAIDRNVTVLDQVRAARIPVYAITNFSREKWAECCQRFAFLNTFDGAIVSAHEGVVKPDPAIYRLLEKRYGLDLAHCVFIDDNAANVAGAQAVGMWTIHDTGPDVCVASRLRELGFRF